MLSEHLNLPSPITHIRTSWAHEAGVELWLKRDDLIHPIISGNKWRKLSGILATHASEKYDEVVTFGGAFSNHLIATASVCAALGKSCTGIVRGEESSEWSGVLKMCRLYGMHLIFESRQAYTERKTWYGIQDKKLIIPEGGACLDGTSGCQNILSETDISNFSKIFVACGTGTTIVGMADYISEINTDSELIGIQVLKGDNYLSNEIKKVYGNKPLKILHDYHCGGYAKTNPELLSFIKSFTAETGVLLDPIYTGKMMYAVKHLVSQNKIKRGEKVLAIHTGGLTGWLGKCDVL
jgi:1-aminocyclopropane-1-carboxylate deaminase